MKLSVPWSSAYNLASGTREGSRGARHEGAEGGARTCRFTTIAHNVVRACNVQRIKIFIVLPRVRAGDASCRLDSLLDRFFFKHPLRASRAVSQRPSGQSRPRFQNSFRAIKKK